jgi:hypothetical protein
VAFASITGESFAVFDQTKNKRNRHQRCRHDDLCDNAAYRFRFAVLAPEVRSRALWNASGSPTWTGDFSGIL